MIYSEATSFEADTIGAAGFAEPNQMSPQVQRGKEVVAAKLSPSPDNSDDENDRLEETWLLMGLLFPIAPLSSLQVSYGAKRSSTPVNFSFVSFTRFPVLKLLYVIQEILWTLRI